MQEPKETAVCENCYKSFKSKQKLQVHDDSVHKGIKFSCKSCGKYFTQKAALNRHMKTAHGISEKNKHDNENENENESKSEKSLKSIASSDQPAVHEGKKEIINDSMVSLEDNSKSSINIPFFGYYGLQ